MWWLIGIGLVLFLIWFSNEWYLFNIYGWFGSYDYAIFKVLLFDIGITRGDWCATPIGWRKVWWRLYRRVR